MTAPAPLHPLLARLDGGDRRSIGEAAAVAWEVHKDPHLIPVLIQGMVSGSPVIQMRAADALEKVSVIDPAPLTPYRRSLLQMFTLDLGQEVRWHLLQVAPRMAWTPWQARRLGGFIRESLHHPSHIVKACALEALVDLLRQDPTARTEVERLVADALRSPVPSLQARARKLRRRLRAQAARRRG